MHYGQLGRDAACDSYPRTASAPGHPQLVQPADPMTDRVLKALGEINDVVMGADAALREATNRLFGDRPLPSSCGGEPGQPNGADEAITQWLSEVRRSAEVVRELAAGLNGRI